MSWDERLPALQERFMILPILQRKSLTQGCVRSSKDQRKQSERDKGAQVPGWKLRELVRQRISMRLCASSPRKKKVGYERSEGRDYKEWQRA